MEEKKGKNRDNDKNHQFVKWFSELSNKDVAIAGGKGASLAEMYNNKFPIPPGFIITARAYNYLIDKSGLDKKIKEILKGLDIEDTETLNRDSKKIRELIVNSEMPSDLEEEIIEAYDILNADQKDINKTEGGVLEILKTGREHIFVAVRSSATTEDLSEASFAGQQETFLNVKGERELIIKVKECFASLFTARATYYRQKKGFTHDKAYLAVVVQKMVDSEKSGVIFSQNPVTKDESILIEAVWGLGEGIVSGRIKPDQYIVDSSMENFKILDTRIGDKKVAIVKDSSGKNIIVKLKDERSKQQVLSSYEIKILAQYAKQLEKHYSKPQDIEFAIERNEIYIVQSRPITTRVSDEEEGEIKGKILASGLGASPGIASGIVKIVRDLSELSSVKKGDVLVTEMTNPDMVVAMQKCAGIVTDEGGLTSHASIVSREMGIPAVVGTGNATKKLKDGEVITVDGTHGKVYEGKTEKKLAEILPVVPTKTKIKVIVDLPDFATRAAKSGVRDVGLVRLEGIIASSGKHPLKYVKESKVDGYINVLIEGLTKICAPFEEIWIRSSDIRSDEYRHLEGALKEVEGNPMMGDHGIRFSLKHLEIMKAELIAVKEIADDFPQKRIGIMIPLVISVDELKKTKALAEEIGMPKNVKIGIMVETPAAVQIISSLCEEGIDFISFGTNDLTQFTLAIDRNNADVQNLYDELHPAVLNSIGYVIKRCRKYNVETSICGQAGSKPEMVKFLIAQGIDSISVNADAAYKISEIVAEIEKSPVEKIEIGRERSKELKKKQEGKKEEEKESLEEEINVPRAEHEEFVVPQMQAVEQEEMQAISEVAREISKQPLPINAMEETSNKDIEDVILKELESEGDYAPSDIINSDKKEIPPLYEAIPVESEDLIEKTKERVEEMNIDIKEEKNLKADNFDSRKAKNKMDEDNKIEDIDDLIEDLDEEDAVLDEEWKSEKS